MDNVKNIFTKKRIAAGALVLAASGSANAALPQAVTDAFGSVSTLVTDMEAAAWPIVTLMVVAFAAIGLFKKFANKAVS